MKRKLWAADLVLLALSAAGVVHLRREWMEARAHRRAVLHKRFQPMPALATTLPPVEAPVKVAGYADIARKMLFSEDRSSAVAIELPPPKAASMPPLPFFHGVIDLGQGPMAILSEGTNGSHRDYQPGDQAGAFKLLAVNNEELVLQWEDQIIRKKVGATYGNDAASAAETPIYHGGSAGPGADMGRGVKACQAGDDSPEGTIVDGMRKAIKPAALGLRCYWESAW